MTRDQLLRKLDRAWDDLRESYAGLPEAELTRPGVVDGWSVQEILAHVTTWEEEALTYLPLILAGGRPPRYAAAGGIDAFNASKTAEKRAFSLAEVRRQMDETHGRLVAYIETVLEEEFRTETRFRHRLRLDTYSHYPIHARAIREWRGKREARSR